MIGPGYGFQPICRGIDRFVDRLNPRIGVESNADHHRA